MKTKRSPESTQPGAELPSANTQPLPRAPPKLIQLRRRLRYQHFSRFEKNDSPRCPVPDKLTTPVPNATLSLTLSHVSNN